MCDLQHKKRDLFIAVSIWADHPVQPPLAKLDGPQTSEAQRSLARVHVEAPALKRTLAIAPLAVSLREIWQTHFGGNRREKVAAESSRRT